MQRDQFLHQIEQGFAAHAIVAILGPRQCGKTTLAKAFAKNLNIPPQNYFDLEDVTDEARLEKPKLALSELEGLVVIDEIQRAPELFPTLRVLVDERPRQFLILGSASRELIQQSSESLAGRIEYLELTPFFYPEAPDLKKLWLRGGFPRSYLAHTEILSQQWRKAYIRTFLEQDIPNLGLRIAPEHLRRFWMMLAYYHGNIFNATEIGASLNISYNTVKHYLDILSGTFMIRQLQPWFENISKRQVKSPKIYFRDSGLWHTLIGILDTSTLLTHPKLGASWEGLALETIIHRENAAPEECYFWAIHQQAELDLLIIKEGKRLGFEFKYTDTPRVTRSLCIAAETLSLDALTVVYPGDISFPLSASIYACGLGAKSASP